jgi:hypothetical protein
MPASDWRDIRQDFEKLPSTDWSLTWTSRPVESLLGVFPKSRWTWLRPGDAGLRARASALFLRAAKACGFADEDQWLDELRYTSFAKLDAAMNGTEMRNGTFLSHESGILEKAVEHSITYCHQLEAGSVPKPIIGALSREAIAWAGVRLSVYSRATTEESASVSMVCRRALKYAP